MRRSTSWATPTTTLLRYITVKDIPRLPFLPLHHRPTLLPPFLGSESMKHITRIKACLSLLKNVKGFVRNRVIDANIGGTTVVSQSLGSESPRHIKQIRTSAILAAARQVLLESDPVPSSFLESDLWKSS